MTRDSRFFRRAAALVLGAFIWSTLLSPTLSLAQTPPSPPPATTAQAPPPTPAPTTTTAPAPATSNNEIVQACNQGEADARTGSSGLGYGVGGFFCGVFGLIFAFSSNPNPPADKLVGKSADYVSTYARCYKQEAKSKNVRASLYGWGIGTAVALIIIIAASNSSSNSSSY